MNDSEKVSVFSRRFERYVWGLSMAWTIVVASSLVWNVLQMKRKTLKAACIHAQVAYDKDVIYRRWNAIHGGVYAPVTEETAPNRYLSDIPERDITTPSGKMHTLINPAYMTRQVHELAEKEYGIRGHITSLNPIRPGNAPDPWEAKALQAFESGETEVSSVEEMEGEEYMRLMRPLFTEKSCLKCHAAQGYHIGDIRGGISVSIPMEPLWAMTRIPIRTFMLTHFLLWAMGIGGLGWGALRLKRAERVREQGEEEIKELNKDLKRQSIELQAANIQLKELDRLKSMFIASMSHELRTPLNSIIGFTGIILLGVTGEITNEQRKQLTIVKDSANHLLALINDIIDVSKIETGKVELLIKEFDLSIILQEVKDSFTVAVDNKGLKMPLNMPEKLVIKSDERRVKQIIVNLVGNAVKFTEDGEIAIKAIEKDGLVEVSVRDTGVGMKKGDIDKLFKAFSRILTEGRLIEGTGLGLYLSQKIAGLLGGDISAESESGKGSTFTFKFPLKYEEAKTCEVLAE